MMPRVLHDGTIVDCTGRTIGHTADRTPFHRVRTMRYRIALGDDARHTITGFAGLVIALTTWLNGCVRVTLQPRELKDGKPLEHQTFDIQEVELVKAGQFTALPVLDVPLREHHGDAVSDHAPAPVPGGPRPEPTRAVDPR